jgi:hypothetical protein
MTNREILSAIKNVEPLFDHIESVVFKIIQDTFDYHIRYIEDISVLDTYVVVYYENSYGGFYEHNSVNIPIEWFNEGFDYKSAYNELLRKAEEEKKKAEAEEKQKQKELQEKKEYDTYLKLKEKYENKELT